MADNKSIPGGLPLILGTDVPGRLSRYDRSTFAADYAIGTTPWLGAIADKQPLSRVTTQYQKERIDQGTSAGENSLSNWWLRSATSWHNGAGIDFYDSEAGDQYRFRDSANVDVWSSGHISLLSDTERVSLVAGSSAVSCGLGAWFVSGTKLYVYKAADSSLTEVTGISNVQKVATDGCSAIVGTSDGVYEVTSSLVVTKLYSAPGTGWTVQAIGYVKDRIMVGAQITDALPMRVFELPRNPASTPVVVDISTTTGHSRYEYKSTSLSFVAITETSGAILVGTNTGIQARVISFTVDTSAGGLAALMEPINIAEFPVGETLNALKSYLNTYVVAATSRGVRVASESNNGLGFVYGPLSILDNVSDIAFDGEYVYATRTVEKLGKKGLWRIDLGGVLEAGYAYAADLSIGDNATPTSVAFIGTTGRALITTAGGVYVEHPTRKAETGYLNSGWIRYGTTENKQPVSFSIITEDTSYVSSEVLYAGGAVSVSVVDSGEKSADFEQVPLGRRLDIPLSGDLVPNVSFEFRVTLSRDTHDTSISPVLNEWQLRALPAPVRSRTITVPLL